MQSLRLIHPDKEKFWEIHWEGAEAETTTGRLGTNGRSSQHEHGSPRETEAFVKEVIAKKRKEGFVEMTAVTDARTAPVAPRDETLLGRIIAAPEDDALRLVYADHLTAQGDPLGELITVQVALAQQGAEDSRRPLLLDREKDLLDRFRGRWSGKLRGVELTFERGFAVAARMRLPDLELCADKLFEVAPLLLRVHASSEFDQWGRADQLALQRLALAPGVERLRELHVMGAVGGSAAVIADSPRFGSLVALSLRRMGIGDDGAERLLSAPHLGGLKRVDWRGNALGTETVKGLAQRRLERLVLSQNRLRATSMERLSVATALVGLRELDVSNNVLGNPGVNALARSTCLTELEELGLANIGCGLEGVRALAGAGIFRKLHTLDLSNNPLRREGVEALLNGELPALRHLTLAEADLGDVGLAALLAAPLARQLESLDLRRNSISAAGVRRLARSDALAALRTLSISSNPVGPEAVAELKESPHFAHVQINARLVELEDPAERR